MASTAVVTAIGCDAEGWRWGLGSAARGPCDSWLGFPRKVRAKLRAKSKSVRKISTAHRMSYHTVKQIRSCHENRC